MESCSESVSRYCFPPNLSSQLFCPQTLMERRVRPWINKKIIEYIGEEEATLVDFVCSKVLTLWEQLFIPLLKRWGKWCWCQCFVFPQVMAHSMPQSILDDVAMVSLLKLWHWFVVTGAVLSCRCLIKCEIQFNRNHGKFPWVYNFPLKV